MLLALAAGKQDGGEAVTPNSQVKIHKLLNLCGLDFLMFREVTVLPTSQGRWLIQRDNASNVPEALAALSLLEVPSFLLGSF